MYSNTEKGKISEDLCCNYLSSRGYEILERNYRTQKGEIDIIALKDDNLSFIEVKTLPKEWDLSDIRYKINNLKKNKIKYTAVDFIQKNNKKNFTSISFDVFVVQGSDYIFFDGVF